MCVCVCVSVSVSEIAQLPEVKYLSRTIFHSPSLLSEPSQQAGLSVIVYLLHTSLSSASDSGAGLVGYRLGWNTKAVLFADGSARQVTRRSVLRR